MLEHIVSPDGKFCWCTDYDTPYHLKEKWIPIEELLEYQKNKEECATRSRTCPICYGSIVFEDEIDVDIEGYCDDDDCVGVDHFVVTKLEPLTIKAVYQELYKYWMPMRIPSLLSEKGLEFRLYGEPDVTPEQLNDAIWDAYNQAKNDLYEAYSEGKLDEEWWEDYELIETQDEEYVIDDNDELE
jgi:hypothetical protein